MPCSNNSTQTGGKFKKRQGRRAPLKSKLKENEFYCLTCKNKRKVRSIKNIEIITAKNGRKVANSQCSAKDCTRKLAKFLSNEQANSIQGKKDKSKK
jgi:hypothetical protein